MTGRRASPALFAPLALLALAGCAASAVPPAAPPRAVRPTPIVAPKGLESVIGQDRAALVQMFGDPQADVVEVYGRKLQWAGRPCILDAYLYPEGRNSAEIAVHVDARRSDGAAVDRVACVTALAKR